MIILCRLYGLGVKHDTDECKSGSICNHDPKSCGYAFIPYYGDLPEPDDGLLDDAARLKKALDPKNIDALVDFLSPSSWRDDELRLLVKWYHFIEDADRIWIKERDRELYNKILSLLPTPQEGE